MKGYVVCVYKNISTKKNLKNMQRKLKQQLKNIKENF